ncbi:MAG: Do family serine endopeptidase [Acidobacteria bacterium]|nr:Do family serine endopeptidase [Acidobacteriota bacterium]
MRNRTQMAGLALVAAAATLFGMVVAGGVRLTTPTAAEVPGAAPPDPRPGAEPAATVALPGFADIAERVIPAVVGIKATEIIRSGESPRRLPNPFEFFFRDTPQDRFHEPRGPERRDSGGSGFLISPDGSILTNYHVIEGSERITVRLPSGRDDGPEREYRAEVVGIDPGTDLALLKIDPDGDLPYLSLGDSSGLRVGDWVMAVGNPIVYDRTVTVGVVSGKGRVLPELSVDWSLDDFIQTDAAINFGNSDGPLVTVHGRVVGVNTAISIAGQGIGFAVPINIAREILDQLKSEGRVARGYLGIELGPVTPDLAEGLGLSSTEGALVNRVTPGLPAAEAGVRYGDVIVAVDGAKVGTTAQLVHLISHKRPGERVRLGILRRGEQREFTARLADRGDKGPAAARYAQPSPGRSQAVLGLTLGELTPEIRNNLELDRSLEGVVVIRVDRTSEAWDQGIRDGNVITEVNQQPVGSVAEFHAALEAAGDRRIVVLYVVDSESARFVTIRLDQN